jgi:hypothetical protein
VKDKEHRRSKYANQLKGCRANRLRSSSQSQIDISTDIASGIEMMIHQNKEAAVVNLDHSRESARPGAEIQA